jgi:hypothetical protein
VRARTPSNQIHEAALWTVWERMKHGPLAAGAALCEAGRYQRRGLFGTKEKGRDSCKNHGPGTLINSNGDVLPWMRRVRDQAVD